MACLERASALQPSDQEEAGCLNALAVLHMKGRSATSAARARGAGGTRLAHGAAHVGGARGAAADRLRAAQRGVDAVYGVLAADEPPEVALRGRPPAAGVSPGVSQSPVACSCGPLESWRFHLVP